MQSQSDTVLNQGVTFGYGDGFNRLTSRTVTSGTLQNYTYAYDRYGNRVSQTPLQGGYTFNPTVNPANNQITTTGYTYDAAGNMLNDGVHSYQYDAEGNLMQVDGGSTAKYVYDVFNQRAQVQTASTTTEYIYDYAGRRVSGWLSPNNFGSQGRIYWDGPQIAFRASDGTNFDHQDILGTERLRTTYSGAVGATYQSLPWGDGYTATVNNSGADQDSLHYAGLEHDAESDTEHAQFRNYASAQGRWLAPDSYLGSYDLTNPQSMNRYAYALNNPVSFTDHKGLTLDGDDGDTVDEDSDGNNGDAGGGGGSQPDCNSDSTVCVTGTPAPTPDPCDDDTCFSGSNPSGPGGGGSTPGGAPNNPTPTTSTTIKQKLIRLACSTSPQNKVLAAARFGFVNGAVRGVIAGATGGAVFEGVGAIPGAIIGGFVGGVAGTAGGVITGGATAGVCSIAGLKGA
jgi:RHS repeat-associated protein